MLLKTKLLLSVFVALLCMGSVLAACQDSIGVINETSVFKSYVKQNLFAFLANPRSDALKLNISEINASIRFFVQNETINSSVICFESRPERMIAYGNINLTTVAEKFLRNKPNNYVPRCNDSTPYGECSATKPYFCYSGNLVPMCAGPDKNVYEMSDNCGCPAGHTFPCSADTGRCGYLPGECTPNAEICDNIDNDCNNMVDEAISQIAPCEVKPGCLRNISQYCMNGVWNPPCENYLRDYLDGVLNEICGNSIDDNCNGGIDESTCGSNSECGTDGLYGPTYCIGNALYRMKRTWVCNNPGICGSYCINNTNLVLVQQCTAAGCTLDGTCKTGTSCSTSYACKNMRERATKTTSCVWNTATPCTYGCNLTSSTGACNLVGCNPRNECNGTHIRQIISNCNTTSIQECPGGCGDGVCHSAEGGSSS